MVQLNYDILTEVFSSGLVIEYEGLDTTPYNRYWYITCADSSIYVYEYPIEKIVGSSYISSIISEFVKMSKGVIYTIMNSKLWKDRLVTLVNINDMNSFSSILTRSLYVSSCYEAIGVTGRLDFTIPDQSSPVPLSVCRDTIVYDMETGNVWDAKKCVIPYSYETRHLELPLNSSLEPVLLRTPTEKTIMKYSISLTSEYKLENLYTDLENFIISAVEERNLFNYWLLSKESWSVGSEEYLVKLIEGVCAYCKFLLPTITDTFTDT